MNSRFSPKYDVIDDKGGFIDKYFSWHVEEAPHVKRRNEATADA